MLKCNKQMIMFRKTINNSKQYALFKSFSLYLFTVDIVNSFKNSFAEGILLTTEIKEKISMMWPLENAPLFS